MSAFDGLVDSFFGDLSHTFGDSATWAPAGKGVSSITVIPVPSYMDEVSGSFAEQIVYVKAKRGDLLGGLPGDKLTIHSGRSAGTYDFVRFAEDDGYFVTAVLRREIP